MADGFGPGGPAFAPYHLAALPGNIGLDGRNRGQPERRDQHQAFHETSMETIDIETAEAAGWILRSAAIPPGVWDDLQ
jgi:hypothetical protein